MKVSREDFLKQQQAKQERANQVQTSGPRVGYFSLRGDGDEAVVRFAYTSPDQFDILTTHQTTDPATGKYRRVNCIRDFKESIEKCPLCAAGVPVQQRFYIKLIEYTKNDDGTITASPKIWERPTSYVTILNDFCTEYGNISDYVFKVRRSGEKGSLQTTYSIIPANQTIYNTTLYPKNDTAFDGYNIVGSAVLDKTFDELKEFVGDTSTQTSTAFEEKHSAPRKVTY